MADPTPEPTPEPTPDPTPEPTPEPTPDPAPSDQPYDDSEIRSLIGEVTSRLDELSAEVKSMAPIDGPLDETPVRRPWTARGRRQ